MVSFARRNPRGARPVDPGPWSEADRKWFERHPRRSHRVRPQFPNEWFARPGEAPGLDMVAVRQAGQGLRLRVPFTSPPSPRRERLREAATTEAGAQALFDLIWDLARSGETEASCAAVEAWIARYARGGSA
jgi:hypothetical protein